MSTTKPQITHPFPDKIMIVLQLAAQQMQSIPYATGQPLEKHHHLIANHFRQRATNMGFVLVQIPGRYTRWTTELGNGDLTVCYGVKRQRNVDGGISIWLEFNPSKATASHLAMIEDDLIELLGFDAPFAQLLPFAFVRNLHVAIDVKGRRLSEFQIVGRNAVGSIAPYAKSRGSSNAWFSSEHGWETINFYTAHAKPRLVFTAYDKRLERLVKDKVDYDHDQPITRLEHKLAPRNLWLADLSDLSNCFAYTGIVDLNELKGLSRKRMDSFVDTMRVRGLEAATTRHGQPMQDQWDEISKTDAVWWTRGQIGKKWPDSLSTYALSKWIHSAATQH